MNKIVFSVMTIILASCMPVFSQHEERIMSSDRTMASDSLVHELMIIDPGFESWLITQPPKNFYSNSYYAQMNRQYVAEWNYRYKTLRLMNLYENYIDYNFNIDYGIDINYKLYNYFRYFEEKNGVSLINRVRK